MKRLIALLLTFTMLLTLAACGGTPAVSPAATSVPVQSEEGGLSTDPVTINVIHYAVEGSKAAAIEKIEDDFSKVYPNVSFVNTAYSQGTDYFAQLETAIASGDMPEIMMGNPGLYTDLIEGGFVKDLTGNEAISALGLTDSDMGDVAYMGKWYAFPVDFKTWGVYYNKAIFEELDLKVPTTQSELLEICEVLNKKGIAPWAQWYSDGASVDIEMRPVVWTQAVQNGDTSMFELLMSGEKKVSDYTYFEDGLKSWQARMGNWARTDATSNDQTSANEIFISGQAAMLYQGTWNYGSIEDLIVDVDFDYGFFLCPTDDSGKECVMNVQVDQSFMINPKAKNADWATKFMEYWLTNSMGDWSDLTLQPCITGATTENTTEFLKTILDTKASGNVACYGEFSMPFSSAYTGAYRKALTAFASYCCTGKATDGVDSIESCLAYMQELFDDEYAQANL